MHRLWLLPLQRQANYLARAETIELAEGSFTAEALRLTLCFLISVKGSEERKDNAISSGTSRSGEKESMKLDAGVRRA